MQKQLQRHIAESERSAFGLPLAGMMSFTLENAKQEMTTMTSNRQITTKTAQAAAFADGFVRCLATLRPAFIYPINRHESSHALREFGFDQLDWKHGQRIRGGIPLVANG